MFLDGEVSGVTGSEASASVEKGGQEKRGACNKVADNKTLGNDNISNNNNKNSNNNNTSSTNSFNVPTKKGNSNDKNYENSFLSQSNNKCNSGDDSNDVTASSGTDDSRCNYLPHLEASSSENSRFLLLFYFCFSCYYCLKRQKKRQQ